MTQHSDILQKDSKYKLPAAARKHLTPPVISSTSVMTYFAFRVKGEGLEYKMEDWLCSKYVKKTRRSHEKGTESREMEERDHFKFTPALFLNMCAILTF